MHQLTIFYRGLHLSTQRHIKKTLQRGILTRLQFTKLILNWGSAMDNAEMMKLPILLSAEKTRELVLSTVWSYTRGRDLYTRHVFQE